MTDSPAALIRRAAALMRERAEAAKELTGDGHGEWFPWDTVRQTEWRRHPEPVPVADDGPFGTGETVMEEGRHEPNGEAFVAYTRWTHDSEESWHEPEFFTGPIPGPLAEHIASWHPLVALAVAGWLEDAAEDAGRELTWEIPSCTHEDSPCDCDLTPGWTCDRCCEWLGGDCDCWNRPLAVARAYLNETDETTATAGEGN